MESKCSIMYEMILSVCGNEWPSQSCPAQSRARRNTFRRLEFWVNYFRRLKLLFWSGKMWLATPCWLRTLCYQVLFHLFSSTYNPLSALLPSELLETYLVYEGKRPMTSTSNCGYVFVLDWSHIDKKRAWKERRRRAFWRFVRVVFTLL